MKKFLVIQTAFIGDAILATALLEKLHAFYPKEQIDFMIRKGNESLFADHPYIRNLWIWDKKGGKYKKLFALLKPIRAEKYDYVINLQRFATTGIFTAFSGAKTSIGFDKNPFSLFFSVKINHVLDKKLHETERNQMLIEKITNKESASQKLYPNTKHFQKIAAYTSIPYICIAPTSVWFTKQYPAEKWISFIKQIPEKLEIYYLGAPSDFDACETIRTQTKGTNLAGKLNLLESAALMKSAQMNYVNDSAPMHIASAMNAPTTAVFCSTVPEFGFGPKADNSFIVETKEQLSCRPCNLHGKKACPEKHFNCAMQITDKQLLEPINSLKS